MTTTAASELGVLAAELRLGVCRLRRRLAAERDPEALSLSAAAVLGTLDRDGPSTISQLAESERVRAPSITRTIGLLVAAGHVSRGPRPGDGRVVVVQITEHGKQHLAAERRAGDDWLARQLGSLTAHEQTILREAAPLLGRLSRYG